MPCGLSRLHAKVRCISWVATVGLLILPCAALSQSVARPDAGLLQQQLDRDRAPALPLHQGLPSLGEVRSGAAAPSDVQVHVSGFAFEGNTLLSEAQLQQVLRDRTGQTLNFAQLQATTEQVMRAYQAEGWVAYAYLPPQDVTSGQVRVRIIEAQMGELVLTGNHASRISTEHIRRIFEAHQVTGQALRIQALDRALLLVSDLPGLQVQGGLSEASSQEPIRGVVIQANQGPLVQAEAIADNAGARATGRERAFGTFNLNSPMGYGELASITAMKTQGSDYLRFELSWPVGYKGWRVGAYDSRLNYRLVAPEFAALNAQGSSQSLGLLASYPVVRSPLKNWSLNMQVERKSFVNLANGVTESQYKNQLVSAGLTGSFSDPWEGRYSTALHGTRGELDLNGSPNQSRDASGAQTAGSYSKWRYNLSRQQAFADRWSAAVTFNGQWANKNLDSSEKFMLGGDTGVRAYPSNEGLGSMGRMVNLELRWRADPSHTLAAFYDWGRTTLLVQNPPTSSPNAYDIKGAGLAWMFNAATGARWKLSLARRIGANPNPASTGTDQDGSLIQNRCWLSVSLPFAI